MDSMASAEFLESRITPASAAFNAGTGVLTISGTANGDSVLVAEGASSTVVSVNSVLLATIPGATTGTIDTITFSGAGASQTLTITGNGPVLNAINYDTGALLNLVVNSNATPTGGTLTVDVGGADLNFGNTNVVGNLTVTDVGDVTDTGRLSVSGTASFDTNTPATDDILLNTTSNAFGSVTVVDANDVTIVEAGDTNLAGVVATGALSVNSTGDVTDSATLTITGTVGVTTTDNGAITLDSAANTFGTLTLTGGKITIVENAATDLAAVTASLGDLNITTTVGAINDSAAISVVNGRATFTANGAGGAITLNNAGHRFKSISAITVGDATIVEVDSTELYTTTVGGNLVVTSGGAIADVGSVLTLPGTQVHSTILVTGATTLTAGGATPTIILDSATNNFDTDGSGDNVVFNGSNVTLVDVSAIEFGAAVATGTLTVTAGGNVTDDGAMAITGKATIRTTGDITFDTSTFGSLSMFGVNATITEAGGTDLLTTSLSGNLSVTTGGANITNGNTLSPVPNVPNYATLEVAGTATFNAGAGNITIQAAGPVLSSFGTLVLTGNVISITEHNATNLGAVTANTFTLFVRDGAPGAAPLGGGVTQTGDAITVTGLATIDATSKYGIVLTGAANNFGSLIFAGRDVTITENSATVFGERSSTTSTRGSEVDRNLILTSAGSITHTSPLVVTNQTFGKLTVNGTATFITTAAGAVVLDQIDPTTTLIGSPTANGNSFGRLVVTTFATGAGDLTITEDGPTNLGTLSIDGDLSVTSSGPITDSGVLTVVLTTTLNAGANTIILDQNDGAFVPVPQNDLRGAISLTGTNLILWNADTTGATDLEDITASGTLYVASTTAISNTTATGVISVTGKATFTTTAGGTAADPVTLGGGVDANFGSISATGVTNLTVDEGSATVLDGITITGNLDVDSTGNITDVGPVLVTGNTDLVSLGAITLDNPSNNFDVGGAPGGDNFDFSATGNVTIVDSAGGIEFDASQGLTLNVKAVGGDVTDAGILTITNAVTITALGNDIILDTAGNTYGTLTLQGATATIVDAGALSIGPSTIQLNNARGALTLTAGGAVTQTGAILAGATSITAGANTIALTNAGNRLGTITTVSGTNVAYTENEGVILGATNANGSLTVIAKGAITQTGAIDANATSLNASASAPITLNDAANSFGVLTMIGSNISITEDNNTTNGGAAGTDLGATTATGTLTVNSSGTVTTSGTLKVTGRATVNGTATFAVTLGSATASFGSVSVVGSTTGNVTIIEGNATDLFTITTTTGNLSVTSAGAITDSGLLTIGGTTTLSAGLGLAAVTLNTSTTLATNDFTGLVTFNGTNVTLVDANAISLDTSAAVTTLSVTATTAVTQGGDLDVTGATTIKTGTGAAGDITLDTAGNTFGTTTLIGNDVDLADSAAADIGASTITGTFDLTAGGAVTQSGSINGGTTPTLTPTGAVNINANAGASAITLTQTNNSFGALTLTGLNISAREADEIVVTTIAGGAGTLSLVSTVSPALTQAITQTGTITATGNTTLTATGTNKEINLPVAANQFGSLFITGSNVTIQENNGTDLGTSTISGTLSITTSNDAITDSGTVQVAGTTTLNAGTAAITLDSANSTYGTLILTGSNVAVTDVGAVDLGATTASGSLTINAGGAITDSGVISVGTTSSFSTAFPAPGAGALITLDSASSYTGSISLYGTNVAITNTAATTTLDIVNVTGNLSVTSDGDITNTLGGLIIVNGTATLDADTGTADDILLNAGGTTNFNTVALDADNVDLTFELNAINLGTSTVDGNLSVDTTTTGGAVTDSGVLTIGGTTTIVATGFTVLFDQATSTFGFAAANTADFVISAGTVSIKDNGSVELGNITVTIGDFTVTSSLAAADSITDIAAAVINVNPGFSTFDAGAGTVNINNGGHQFGVADLSYTGIGGTLVNIVP